MAEYRYGGAGGLLGGLLGEETPGQARSEQMFEYAGDALQQYRPLSGEARANAFDQAMSAYLPSMSMFDKMYGGQDMPSMGVYGQNMLNNDPMAPLYTDEGVLGAGPPEKPITLSWTDPSSLWNEPLNKELAKSDGGIPQDDPRRTSG